VKAEFITSSQIENGLREEECAWIERSTALGSFSKWWAVTNKANFKIVQIVSMFHDYSIVGTYLMPLLRMRIEAGLSDVDVPDNFNFFPYLKLLPKDFQLHFHRCLSFRICRLVVWTWNEQLIGLKMFKGNMSTLSVGNRAISGNSRFLEKVLLHRLPPKYQLLEAPAQ
jgi:hypothetical protein